MDAGCHRAWPKSLYALDGVACRSCLDGRVRQRVPATSGSVSALAFMRARLDVDPGRESCKAIDAEQATNAWLRVVSRSTHSPAVALVRDELPECVRVGVDNHSSNGGHDYSVLRSEERRVGKECRSRW